VANISLSHAVEAAMDATVAAATVSDQEPVEGVAGAFEPIDLPSSKSDWAVKVRELTKRKDTSS
jgi:hypothetical protein